MSFTTNKILLIFRVAGIPFAVPAQSVGSILMPPEHVTHTPGSHRSTPGIFHHAQATYAVIDLHERFSSGIPRHGRGRMLLHEEGIRHFAFLVDEVVGLMRSEEGTWANLPPYLPRDIFPIGFLHQEEIILCSELPLLRNMHDVEPLRRHAEQLKQQQTVKETAEKTTSIAVEKAVEKPAKKPAQTPADRPVEKTTTGTEREHKTTEKIPSAGMSRAEEQKSTIASPPTPPTLKPAEPATTQHEEKPLGEKPLGEKPPIEKRPGEQISPSTTSRPKQQVVRDTTEIKQPGHTEAPHLTQQTPPPAKTPYTPPHREPLTKSVAPPPAAKPVQKLQTTTEESTSDNSWLWLLLFLLLLVALPFGYWLWPSSQPPHRSPTRVTISPPEPSVVVVEEPVEATKEQSLRDTRDEESPASAAEPSPQIEHDETPPATGAEPPLRIERDEDGTINLIIDRQAVAQSSSPTSAQTETATTMETSDSGTIEATPSSEEKPVVEDVPPSTGEKTVTVEVPAPSNGPEPCDCTHIVVKGDTLWDIAELYTGNAFNYPELAKRSGIKNPHRIYPGDRVRIIIR